MEKLEINCPDGYIIDQEKSDLKKGIIEFKEVKNEKSASTYQEVSELLFSSELTYFTNASGKITSSTLKDPESMNELNNATTKKQLESILALNKLCNVAKYLNGDWLPDWGNGNVCKFSIFFDGNDSKIEIDGNYSTREGTIYFKSEKDVLKAIKILGEEEIRRALTLNH